MAPKKKGNKKAQDDWESEMGETVDPIAQAEERAKEEDAAKDADESVMAGGLLAALKKNRGKKAKKGKVVEDFVEGEDAPTGSANGDADAEADAEADIAAKAPQEATFDDNEEDIYSGPVKKGKGAKGGKQPDKADDAKDDDVEERDASGRVKTKKEKEKEKKEREKQRKKEQASLGRTTSTQRPCANREFTGSEEEDDYSSAAGQGGASKGSTRSQGP
jgi:translation initiation factor 5B